MTAPRELQTPRLLLRSIESEDVPAIVRLAGVNEIAATTLNIPHPYSENDARSFLAKANEDFRQGHSVSFAISILPGRELCGAIGLHIADMHRRAELGYWIGVPFLGKGFSTGGGRGAGGVWFLALPLHTIYAH